MEMKDRRGAGKNYEQVKEYIVGIVLPEPHCHAAPPPAGGWYQRACMTRHTTDERGWGQRSKIIEIEENELAGGDQNGDKGKTNEIKGRDTEWMCMIE